MKKLTFSFILAFLATFILASCGEDESSKTPSVLEIMGTEFASASGTDIPFRGGIDSNASQVNLAVLQRGLYSKINKRSILLAKNSSELNSIWTQHNEGEVSLPEVDFENEMVIAVFSGIKSDSGYSLDVTNVWEANGKLVIGVKEKVETGAKFMVITNPNIWLKIPKSNLPIEVSFV